MHPLHNCVGWCHRYTYTPLLSDISVTAGGVPLPLPPLSGPVISSTIAASAWESSTQALVSSARLALCTLFDDHCIPDKGTQVQLAHT